MEGKVLFDTNVVLDVLLSIFEIILVNRIILERALRLDFVDFEDAVLYEGGSNIEVEYIITRDIKRFKESVIPVFNPVEFINMLESISMG